MQNYVKMVIVTSCAAKHFCRAPHIPLTSMHCCRKCGGALHVFCAGVGTEEPSDNLGREYDCALCCGGIFLNWFTVPDQTPNIDGTYLFTAY